MEEGELRLNKRLQRCIMIFVMFSLVFSFYIVDPTTGEDSSFDLVEASINIDFLTGTNLKLTAVLDVQRINVFDTTYDSNEIESIADTNLEILGAIKLSLRNVLKNQINSCFDNAIINAINQIPNYENKLFYDEFNIDLVSPYFGLNDSVNSENLVNGVLDIGAVVEYDFHLVTEQGWNNSYTFVLPDFISFYYANGAVSSDRKEINWILKWNTASSEKDAELSIRYKDPTTVISENEDVFITFGLDSSNVNNVSLKCSFSIKTLDIQGYDFLPDFITGLPFIPSDGMRLFVENDLILWDDFYEKTIIPIEENAISTIEKSSFNQTLTMSFNWDSETSTNCTSPYNITNMDDSPAVIGVLTSARPLELNICEMSSRAFLGLVNSGANANISEEDINFGDNLDDIGVPYEILLYLPEGMYLKGENVYRWNDSITFSGLFSSDLQPSPKYSEEKIDTYIDIDIKKMDLNIPSFFTGTTEFTATTKLTEKSYIYVTEFPLEFEVSDKINLNYMNSDAFRVCVEEFVFLDYDVDNYLSNKKYNFENLMSNALNGLKIKGVIDKDIYSDSLIWDQDISHMDDVSPIICSNHANKLYPVSFGLSIWPPSTHISNQTFRLKGIENQTVTYRVIYPKGISVNAKDTLNKSILKGKTIDGREYIEISFEPDEYIESDILSCKIVASSLYMLGQFLPCIISFVLVIILIVIVYILRKKRRGKKMVVQEEMDTTGYEDEDFYVPPPPK